MSTTLSALIVATTLIAGGSYAAIKLSEVQSSVSPSQGSTGGAIPPFGQQAEANNTIANTHPTTAAVEEKPEGRPPITIEEAGTDIYLAPPSGEVNIHTEPDLYRESPPEAPTIHKEGTRLTKVVNIPKLLNRAEILEQQLRQIRQQLHIGSVNPS